MPLTDKQQRFCDEYQVSFNATQAAIRAGYSKKTANEQGSRLLANVSIQQELQKKKDRVAKKLEITQEMVLEGYRKLAFYDARKFYDDKGNLKDVVDLDDETAFALSGFDVMEEKGGNGQGKQVVLGYTKKIKMSDRKGALDSICKVLGYNSPDKVAQTDTEGKDVSTQLLSDSQFNLLLKTLRERPKTS